jgi:iron complex transport system permease protein
LLLQGVVRNPLAAPDLVGVMSGAGVGAMVLTLAFPEAPVALVPVAAFVGAVVFFAVVYAGAWREGIAPERLALVGIGVSALGTSIINTLIVRSETRLAQALVWLSGSTYAQGWTDVVALGGWALVLVPGAWLLARQLDVLALGDAAATGLGMNVERARIFNLGIAVALAAASVATVGTIGFVGLVAPHAARLLVGGRHRRLVPVALLLGAVILVVADVVGRVVLAPSQIPSGLVAAILGAPYFVWLLGRTGSRA